MEEETKEVWRRIKGFPRYKISNKGRVKSFTNPKNPKILRAHKNKGGYLFVHLSKGKEWGANETVCVRIHQLVARAFIPNPDNKCHIDHIDCNRENNYVHINADGTVDMEKSNLRWVTPQENAANPITKERRLAAIPQRLEKVSKPVLVYDENLTLLSAFTATAEAARQLNLSQGNIVNCCSGSLRRYKNLIFSFIPLNTIQDREKVEEEGEAKRLKRIRQVNKACIKMYWKNPIKARERAKLFARKKYGFKGKDNGGNKEEETRLLPTS